MNKSFVTVGGALFLCLFLITNPASGERVRGVDVSQWQFNMNWDTTYDAGIRFAFIRASRGGPMGGLIVDSSLDQHMAGAGDAGILRGAYHFSRPAFLVNENLNPGTADDQPTVPEITAHAISEAQHFYDTAGQYMTEGFLRPVLDLEEYAIMDGFSPHPAYEPLTNTTLTTWANTFIDHLQGLSGAEALVYMNSTFARDRVTADLNHRDLWLARYNLGHPGSVDPETSNPETPAGSFVNPYGVWNDPIGGAPSHDSWSFWQYSNAGHGATYGSGSTYIDLDLFNGSMAELREQFVIPEPGAATLAVGMAFLALARRRRG